MRGSLGKNVLGLIDKWNVKCKLGLKRGMKEVVGNMCGGECLYDEKCGWLDE